MQIDVSHCRVELWRGVVHKRRFLDPASGSAVNRLLCEVGKFCIDDSSRVCLAGGTGFLIEQDPDTVIAPNGAIFVHSDLSSCSEDEYLTIASDIVLETWTPNGRAEECRERASWWLRFGVKQVWELNTGTSDLIVYQHNAEAQVLSIGGTLNGGTVLPGFTLPIRRVFPDAR
jgi:hypothetical protein